MTQLMTQKMKRSFPLLQAVFSVDAERGLTLTEVAEGEAVEDIVEQTGAEFAVADQLGSF